MGFCGYLKESATGISVRVGPVFNTDGTLNTSATIAVGAFFLAHGNTAAAVKTGSGATLDPSVNGRFTLPIASTDLTPTGRFTISLVLAGTYGWEGWFTILDAASFDTWISGVAPWAVELTAAGILALDPQIQDSVAAVSAPNSAEGAITTVGAINTPTAGQQLITLGGTAVSGTNRYIGQTLWLASGSGGGQSRPIRAQAGLVVTVDNFDIQPAAADLYVVDWGSQSVLPVDIANVSNLDATVSSRASATNLATANTALTNVQSRLPAALVSGRIDASVGAMAADVITAAAIQADAIGSSELAATAVTEIQAGLATSASQTTMQADLDDIQNRLPAALVAGRMDSSVGAMASNVMTAAAAAADLTTELQAGLATAAGLTTATANLDVAVSSRASGANLALVQADTDDIQTRLPAALVAGRMDASVGAMAANTMTAAAAAADLTTELQGGLATAAALVTAQADLDDIQTRLPAALVAGRMASDAVAISGSTVAADEVESRIGFLDASVSGVSTGGVSVADIADAVWDEARTGHTTAGTFGFFLDSAVSGVSTGGLAAGDIADAVLDELLSGHVTAGSLGATLSSVSGRLPAALSGGRIDATIGAVQADAITATGLAADVTSELQTGLATAAALSTAAGNIVNIQGRLPAALVAGRIDASVGAMGANTMTAAAAAPDLTTELQAGLATAAALTAATANLDVAVSTRASSTALGGVASDVGSALGRLPVSLVGGRMDASVGAMAANTVTAAAAAADLTTELQAGLATAAGLAAAVAPLATAAGLTAATANLDTTVSSRAAATALAAVQADTDDIQGRLPAALVAGRMVADVTAIAGDVAGPAALNLAAGRVDVLLSSRSTYAGGPVASVSAPVTVGTITDKTGYALSSAGVNAIADTVDILRAQADSEPLDQPAGPIVWGVSTRADMLAWLGAMNGANPKRQTPTLLSLRDTTDTATIGQAAVADVGGVLTVGRLV